ncbi:MAG: hypothetical protein KA534_03620 [Sediminibacterium sp.]|nr:hypothetical protein [Sediminibacterium sp.]MBP6144665.1 hypothetical protein [Sediminibacterium sp.]
MKTCKKCKLPKDDFRKSKKYIDNLDVYCKECRRIADKNSYNSNLTQNRKAGLESKNKARERNRQFIRDYLVGKACIDCGEDDPVVLEFDHFENKKENLSILIQNSSIAKIEAEIKKCNIRCANCHRRKTAIQLGYHKIKIVG